MVLRCAPETLSALPLAPVPANPQPFNLSPPANPRTRDSALIAIALTAAAFGVPVDELRARTRRQAPIAFARQVAVYLTHTIGGFSLTDVARAFGRDRTTAAHACHVIEDQRDDLAFDARLSALEQTFKASLVANGI